MSGRIADVRHLHTQRHGLAWRYVDVVKFSLLALWYGASMIAAGLACALRALLWWRHV